MNSKKTKRRKQKKRKQKERKQSERKEKRRKQKGPVNPDAKARVTYIFQIPLNGNNGNQMLIKNGTRKRWHAAGGEFFFVRVAGGWGRNQPA